MGIPYLHQEAYHHEAFLAKPLPNEIEFLIAGLHRCQCSYHTELLKYRLYYQGYHGFESTQNPEMGGHERPKSPEFWDKLT